jgi:putative endonuclease
MTDVGDPETDHGCDAEANDVDAKANATDSAGAGGQAADSAGAGDHAVYVLECGDGSLYTGYTTDVARRVDEHQAGEGAKYTRGRRPVDLVHVERFESRSAALSREHEIKTRSRRAKERLVAGSPTPSVRPDQV